jgi:hypothetical protein
VKTALQDSLDLLKVFTLAFANLASATATPPLATLKLESAWTVEITPLEITARPVLQVTRVTHSEVTPILADDQKSIQSTILAFATSQAAFLKSAMVREDVLAKKMLSEDIAINARLDRLDWRLKTNKVAPDAGAPVSPISAASLPCSGRRCECQLSVRITA